VLFSGAELHQQLGALAYPSQSTSISAVPKKTRYQTTYVLPEGELKSTYGRHVARLFNQDRIVANLGRASPHAPASGVTHGVLSDAIKPITESEFTYRLSTYETKPEDAGAKDEVGMASFTSHKDFATPGKFRASCRDRSSLLRSAHLAQEPLINLKPKSQEFGLNCPIDFVLSPREMAFAFGSVEPLFGTLSLWDAANGLKLTEDFTFHLNAESGLALIGGNRDIDPIWAAKNFGLTIEASQRTSRIYLLLVVSKVLVGDLDSTVDIYTKGKDVKEKDRNKFITENSESVKQLKAFRQQIALAAHPLFKEDGSLNVSSSGDVKVEGFTRIKTIDVASFLEEAYKADRKEKDRKGNMPGIFQFQVLPFTAHMNHTRISPTLAYAETIVPSAATVSTTSTATSGSPPVPKNLDRIREVANFVMPSFGSASSTSSSSAMQALPAIAMASSLYSSHLLPATEPLNNVYFMPTKLNIDHLGGSGSSSSSARNICMEVKLLISDSNPDAVGQAWLHGNSTYLSKSTFVTAARSTVWYHNKKPRFLDEFKFHLPITVSDKHHIMVTFFHVNCKISSKSDKAGAPYDLEEPIAYSAIPLLPRASATASSSTMPHKLIRNGIYAVPVVAKSSIGPKYLDADLFDLDSESSSSKGMLEFQIRVNSNVHSADAVIDEYLQAASGLHSMTLENAAVASLEAFLARGETSLLHQSRASASPSDNSGSSSHGNAPGSSVNKKEILRFLSLLLTTHLSLLGHESKKVRSLAFIAILQTLVDAVEASPQTAPSQIQSYIDLIFDSSVNTATTSEPSTKLSISTNGSSSEKLYMIILHHWAGLNSQLSPLRDVAMRFAWVFAGLVVKSAALHLADEKRIASEVAGPLSPKSTAFSELRSKWFPKAFYDALIDFFSSAATATRQYHSFDHLSSFVAHRFSVHMASFVSDLYALVDRGQLNKAVLIYLDKMVNYEDPNSSRHSQHATDHIVSRCLFFKVLSQHPNFYAWNLPEIQDFKSGSGMIRMWQQRHVLVAAWLDTFKMSYHQSSSESARDLIMDTIIDMMFRLDSNPDLIDEEAKIASLSVDSHYLANVPSCASLTASKKNRIAALFTPYVYYLIDKVEYLESPLLSTRERSKALIPFVWVLKNAPYDVLAKYWERDSEKRIFALLKLCTQAANLFELAPEKLIRVKREHIPLPNPLYSLQQMDLWAAMSSGDASATGGSNPPSRNGTGNSAAMQAALDEGASGHPSDSDHLGLLSSGMRALQVPGGTGTVKKKNRRGSDLPSSHSPHSSGMTANVQPNQGTLRRKGELELEVRREMNFCREVSLVLIDNLVAFANTFPRALKRRDTFEQMWAPLLALMGLKLTVDATELLLETVYHLLPAFKVHLFAKQNSACPDLIYHTLKACTAPQMKIRKCALSVLMRVIQSNYVATSNIDRFRLQATIAIIKVVGGGQQHVSQNSSGGSPSASAASASNSSNAKGDFARIKASLAKASRELLKDDAKAILQPSVSVVNVRTAVGKDASGSSSGTAASALTPSEMASKRALISKGLEELEKKVEKILEDNAKMKQYEYDSETLIDLYYAMSRNLEDSPDERIGWLENVAEMHKQNGNLEECAQTKLLIAVLVQAYLKILGRWDLSQKMVPAFHLVAPNMDDEATSSSSSGAKRPGDSKSGVVSTTIARELHHSLRSVKDEVCQSSTFSAKGFGTLLAEAIQLLKEGGFYESCAAAYRMILPTYYENDNYQMQKRCYAELQWLCQQILDENVMKQRIFSNYYRVVVYGSKLGSEVNGVEFVYKELPTMRLMDFSEKMKRSYEGKFGEGNVVILPNTQIVKPNELDQQKIYMQLCNVEVYWSPEQLVERNTGFKQQFGVHRFVMEQPFTKPKGGKDGAAQAGGFEDQHIRRTIFTTKECFPHLLKRSRVVDKEEVELSPIECAIALIEKRTRALKAELSSSSPNMKNIQRELQGAVLTQVNAGPLAVISTFLSDANANKYTSTTTITVSASGSNSSPSTMRSGGTSSPHGTQGSSALSAASNNAPSMTQVVSSHREILADCVSEFERSVAFGLALNKAMLVGAEESTSSATTSQEAATQVTLQEELAKGLDRLRAAMAACAVFASRKDARAQLDEEQRRMEAERAHRTLGDENGASVVSTPREKPTKQASLIKKPESTPRTGIPRSVSSTPESSLPTALPPPLDASTPGKTSKLAPKDDKSKEKDKDKDKPRKLKKAATEAPASTSAVAVPNIKLPPPLASLPPPIEAPEEQSPKAPQSPSTATLTALTTMTTLSPRARAASASQTRSQITQADKDKEREEREKERLAELKLRAKKTETTRTSGLSPRGELTSPKRAGLEAASSSSSSASPAAKEEPAALTSPVFRKKILGDIDALTDDLISKASVMQMGIPEASEPAELAPLIKSLKTFKDAVNVVLAHFPIPPNPTLRPSPANNGDKLAFFKSVCSNEIENIKTTLQAVSEGVGQIQSRETLLAISNSLQQVAQVASGV
jgi:hypothetical protein